MTTTTTTTDQPAPDEALTYPIGVLMSLAPEHHLSVTADNLRIVARHRDAMRAAEACGDYELALHHIRACLSLLRTVTDALAPDALARCQPAGTA